MIMNKLKFFLLLSFMIIIPTIVFADNDIEMLAIITEDTLKNSYYADDIFCVQICMGKTDNKVGLITGALQFNKNDLEIIDATSETVVIPEGDHDVKIRCGFFGLGMHDSTDKILFWIEDKENRLNSMVIGTVAFKVKAKEENTVSNFKFSSLKISDYDNKIKYSTFSAPTEIKIFANKSTSQTPTSKPKDTQKPTESQKPDNSFNNNFLDVKSSDWFYNNVKYVVQNGYFKGTSDTTFEPNSKLTRGMLVTVLYRYDGTIEKSKSMFDDVNENAYYSEAVAWANKNNIVYGIGNNQFNPDGYITRQDLATMIYRYLIRINQGFNGESNYNLTFNDKNEISDYAYESICWCVKHQVLNGKGNNLLDPKGFATRAETAAIIHRINI